MDAAGREAPVSFTTFAIGFIVIAGAMAVWVDVRFPRLAPNELRDAVIRLGVAVLASHAAVPVASYLGRPMSDGAADALIVAVGFLALTFLMLSVVWIVKMLQQLLGGMLR